MTGIIDNLLIYPKKMRENMDKLKGLVNSQQVLLKLTQSGFRREEAYLLIQDVAMKVWDGEGTFLSLLTKHKRINQNLKTDELEALFDESYHTKNVNFIFKRVFKNKKLP